MGTQSQNIRRTEPVIRLDGTGTGSRASPTRIPLKKESLMAALLVRIQVSHLFATTAPTSSDVRRFIENISIETSDGRRKFMTGHQAYDLGRFTQRGDNPIVALGSTSVASTADFDLVLHHINDGALFDMMGAIDASKLNTFDLVINWASDTNNGFIGGTATTGLAAYTVTARSVGYPDLLLDQNGNPHAFVESFRHVDETQTIASAGGAGTSFDFRLTSGNKTRFIMVHAFDTSGTNPVLANTIVNNMRVVIGGKERRVTTFPEQQKQNVRERLFNQIGVCVLDWHDDEAGHLDLRGSNEPKLTIDVGSQGTLPASYRIDVCQDYNIIMK